MMWTLQMLFLSFVGATIGDFSSSCPVRCVCSWASGHKQADCSGAHLREIPTQLSPDIQILNLTDNDLNDLKKNAFVDTLLINLKKLHLRKCNLTYIQKEALNGLSIMIELDLSKNELIRLEPDTFKEIFKIRWILLNDNKLVELEDGLFKNLQFLQKVDLSNNHIQHLGDKTFMNVPKLNTLKLGSNRLVTLNIDTMSALSMLMTLELQENPWRCDCSLQPFINWVVTQNLCSKPIFCAEPAQVQNKRWDELDSSYFACRSNTTYVPTNTTLRFRDSNVTFTCQVNGNELPEVNLAFRCYKQNKYNQTQSSDSKDENLTLINADTTDNGEYLCVPTRTRAIEEKIVTP